MRKIDEFNDVNSCLSKAKLQEMLFVLLGRDEDAPATIRYWCARRIERGRNKIDDPKIIEAIRCAMIMESEREPQIG